jgi:Flp pilus assembly protein TadG
MNILTHLRRAERGQSMVELALVLPVCLWIMLGIVDFGRVVHIYVGATNAAREGARYWASNPTAAASAVQAKVQAEAAPGLTIPAAGITLSSPATDQRRVQVQLQFTPIAPLISTAWGGGSLTITTQATMPSLS